MVTAKETQALRELVDIVVDGFEAIGDIYETRREIDRRIRRILVFLVDAVEELLADSPRAAEAMVFHDLARTLEGDR